MPTPTDLTLTQLAQLAVIVDFDEISLDLLRALVPQPEGVSEWVDNLQTLLDRELVIRVAGKSNFVYSPTADGTAYLRAHLHPSGRTMENLS